MPPVASIAFQSAMRSAAVSLLTAYAASASIKLQVYPGRPRTLYPPCAFVDRLSETLVLDGPRMRQRTPRAVVVVVHGIFDSKETVDQRDAFVDGFLDWVFDNPHATGSQTILGNRIETSDIPGYVPEWIEDAYTYYATEISLEGEAGG